MWRSQGYEERKRDLQCGDPYLYMWIYRYTCVYDRPADGRIIGGMNSYLSRIVSGSSLHVDLASADELMYAELFQ